MPRPDPLLSNLRGPFNFIDPAPDALRFHYAELVELLPEPRPIFPSDGQGTATRGFAVLRTRGLEQLSESLRAYVESEERAQIANLTSVPSFSLREHQEAWKRYRSVLEEVFLNVLHSNYGRRLHEIFWLRHSTDLVAALRGTANRIRRIDLQIGKQRGEQLRYMVLFRLLQGVTSLSFDLAARVAKETAQSEQELFPSLLTFLRDNVLIVTEDHISPGLEELVSYFRGYLKVDGRDLLYRLALLRRWHVDLLERDHVLQTYAAGPHSEGAALDPDRLLYRHGYFELLTAHPEFDHSILSEQEARQWAALLQKLREFELLNSVRRMIVDVTRTESGYQCDGQSSKRVGLGARITPIHRETRPLDFESPWIIDPEVSRVGLIYDITEFSAVVSILRLSDRSAQDGSYRQIFSFQHQINQIGSALRLRLEKYLGDGAFYSGRNPLRMLVAAVRIQRAYIAALDAGFPFDRGIRLALNYGTYRLLPLGGDQASEQERYEVYGHGLVELSRLVSGKKGLDFEEIKSVLIARGYDDFRVNDFFSPVSSNVDSDSNDPADGRFVATLSSDGALVNEGIVATEPFLLQLQHGRKLGPIFKVQRGKKAFVVLVLASDGHRHDLIAFRKLGLARLKGLDKVPVYEVVDAQGWKLQRSDQIVKTPLLQAVNQVHTTSLVQRDRTRRSL